MIQINIQFSLFSAFYSPLISTMSGGFLEAEGLEANWSVSAPGVSAIAGLEDGSQHVVQSALSQGLMALTRGEVPGTVHFAQVNETDGFFITGRDADDDFDWRKLESAEVLVHHGGQPMTMFKYACHKAGMDFSRIKAIDAGKAADMDAAFRAGQADYIHQQGPAPRQLAADGVGHVLARVGEQVGSCGFSSLAYRRDWLESDMAAEFLRAYRKIRAYIAKTPAGEIARAQANFFPDVDADVLTTCISDYQQLGCWTPHVEITPAAFEAAQDIFEHVGALPKRFDYGQVCALPPEAD